MSHDRISATVIVAERASVDDFGAANIERARGNAIVPAGPFPITTMLGIAMRMEMPLGTEVNVFIGVIQDSTGNGGYLAEVPVDAPTLGDFDVTDGLCFVWEAVNLNVPFEQPGLYWIVLRVGSTIIERTPVRVLDR